MAEILSDSPLSVTADVRRDQHSHNSMRKRSYRNRKHRQQPAVQSDGMVSESALNPATSPRPRRQNKVQQNLTAGAGHIHNTSGKSPVMKPRPVSMESPIQEQAYAGPTFQSSPAASSLPIPRFFAKSARKAVGDLQPQGRLANGTSSEDDLSSPESDAAQPPALPRDTQQSPLDMFFKADRAEREKMRTASHGDPLESTHQAQQASEAEKPPHLSTHPQARNGAVSSPPHIKIPADQNDEERRAYTQSLKNLLFVTAAQQASTPPRARGDLSPGSNSPDSVYFTPSPFQRPPSGPSTPQNGTDQYNVQGLHYGNRNLSPLFKAARSDTPPRPSSLRQEVSCDGGSTTDSAIDLNSPPQISAHQYSPYQQYHVPYQRSSHADWNPFTPAYAAYQSRNPTSSNTHHPTSGSPAVPHGAGYSSEPSVGPRAGGPNDIRNMEDDLRRILKLDMLS